MIWQSAHFWRDPNTGKIWMALRGHPNHRDGSMGPCSDYTKSLAWCRSHNLKITDDVAEGRS